MCRRGREARVTRGRAALLVWGLALASVVVGCGSGITVDPTEAADAADTSQDAGITDTSDVGADSVAFDDGDGPAISPPPTLSCGDGLCAGDETPEVCPADCVAAAPATLACLVDHCQTSSCPNVPECAAALNCVAGCLDAVCTAACVDDAPAPVQAVIASVVACGEDVGCLEADGSPVPECGDGLCQGEELFACPADCDAEPPPGLDGLVGCILEGCDVGPCLELPQCVEALACLATCQDQGCVDACVASGPAFAKATLATVALCAEDVGCITLVGPHDVGLSCLEQGCSAGNCFDYPACADALACVFGCDSEACVAACVGAAPPPTRSLLTDVIECGADLGCFESSSPALACIDEGCDAEACLASPACHAALACVAGCQAAACVEECVAAAPPEWSESLEQLAICGSILGCLQ